MFREAYRSSSGAPNRICSLWFIYCNKVKDFLYRIYTKSFTLLQYINQRLQIKVWNSWWWAVCRSKHV